MSPARDRFTGLNRRRNKTNCLQSKIPFPSLHLSSHTVRLRQAISGLQRQHESTEYWCLCARRSLSSHAEPPASRDAGCCCRTCCRTCARSSLCSHNAHNLLSRSVFTICWRKLPEASKQEGEQASVHLP